MSAQEEALPDDAVARVLRGFHQDMEVHRRFETAVDRRYRAYRGILERRTEAASWTNKQHPAYILQVIETMIASSLDPSPSWQVKARPTMSDPITVQAELDGAQAMELLLNEQLEIDNFASKDRPFKMQGFIAGLTVAKNYWRWNEAPRTRLTNAQVPVVGTSFTVPQIQAVSGIEVMHDNPTMEVVDVRDFIWHQAATSLEKSMRITHRTWMSMDELRQLEAAGTYVNVDQLSDSQDFSGEVKNREQIDGYYGNRTKNKVEVLEQWFYEAGMLWVVTIGNRKVCLTPGGKAKPNPFWHGEYPFVTAASMPDLFRIPGISEVEVIQDLQEMLWTLMNQRLDNLQLLNNAIAVIRSDVDDPDAFEFAPGERWLVDDINQVKFLETPPITAELAIQAEAGIKSDMQNISGGMPMLSGSDQQLDSNTATAASIFTSLAQRRLAAKKQNYTIAYGQIGTQWVQLNQQFIRESRVLQMVGQDGVPLIKNLNPTEIQGRYHLKVEEMDESMVRQERRAEAQARLQTAVSVALPLAQSQTPLNLKAFVDDYLKAWGVADTTKYYSSKSPLPSNTAPAHVTLTGQLTPGQEQQAAQGAGMTAPQATDANSPSNAFSQSPVAAQQRMGAMAGGGNNT